MLINSDVLKRIDERFKAIYQERLAKLPTWYLNFMELVVSPSLTTTYSFVVRSSRMREWIGDRTLQNLKAHSFTIVGKNWESTVGVDRNHLVYDQLGQVHGAIMGLADDKIHHFSDLCAAFIQNGTAAPYLAYDLKPLFATDHPQVATPEDASVVAANYYAATALNTANVAIMDAAMKAIKGDNGRVLNIRPNVLWYATSQKAAAETLIKKQNLAGGESNVDYGRYELLEIPELGGTSKAWGLLDTNQPEKALIHQTSYETDPRWIEEPGEKKLEGSYGFDLDGNAGIKWWQMIARADAP